MILTNDETVTRHTCSAKAKASVQYLFSLSPVCSMFGIVKDEINMLKSWYLHSTDEAHLLNLDILTL